MFCITFSYIAIRYYDFLKKQKGATLYCSMCHCRAPWTEPHMVRLVVSRFGLLFFVNMLNWDNRLVIRVSVVWSVLVFVVLLLLLLTSTSLLYISTIF